MRSLECCLKIFIQTLLSDDLDKCTNLWKIPVFWSFKGQEPGFTSLTEVLQEEWFCRKERLCVAIDICKLLHKLHDWKITQEKLTTDDIFIKKTDQVTQSVKQQRRSPTDILYSVPRGSKSTDTGLPVFQKYGFDP